MCEGIVCEKYSIRFFALSRVCEAKVERQD